MELNKKAIVFTSVVVIFTFIVMSTYLFLYRNPIDIELDVAEIKVRNTNYFLSQIDTYMTNTLILTGQSAIERTINISITTDQFIENYTQELVNCMYLGNFTHNFGEYECENESHLFYNLEYLTNLSSEKLNIYVEFTNIELSVTQTSPWFVDVTATYNVNAGDGYANWSLQRQSRGRISIIGFRDVVYEVNTSRSDSYSQQIFRGGKATGRWLYEPNDLNDFIKYGAYMPHNQGVKFLDRLAGNFTPGQHGILSIVDPNNLTDGYVEYPHIDFYFWQENCPTSDLVKFDFSTASLEERTTTDIMLNEGIDGVIITESLADYTNNTQHRTSWSCP